MTNKQEQIESIKMEEIVKRLRHLEEIVNGVDSIIDEEPDLVIEQTPQVTISSRAYLKLATHAMEHANAKIPQSKWVEVIGLLTGKLVDEGTPRERVVVREYWPVGSGDSVSVSIMEAEPMIDVFNKKLPDEFIIGWAHSHPSYSPFLSTDDVATHIRYQNLWPQSIAIVIDPKMITRTNPGIGVFRLSPQQDSYYALDFQVDGLSNEAIYEALEVINTKI